EFDLRLSCPRSGGGSRSGRVPRELLDAAENLRKQTRRQVALGQLQDDVPGIPDQASDANSLWGSPRIHGELQKLGIEIAQATVPKYLARRRPPPSLRRLALPRAIQSWSLNSLQQRPFKVAEDFLL